MLSLEKSVFAFALVGQRVEADKNLIDHPRMTHDDAAFRQAIEKLSHQRAEIRLPGKIIGAGEAGIECDIGARSAAAKLRAQDIENQRLGGGGSARRHTGQMSFSLRRGRCTAGLCVSS